MISSSALEQRTYSVTDVAHILGVHPLPHLASVPER